VLGITHEHGGVFKWRDGKIHIARSIIKRGRNEDKGNEEVKGESFFGRHREVVIKD
jgi:hypothetical protein